MQQFHTWVWKTFGKGTVLKHVVVLPARGLDQGLYSTYMPEGTP